MSEEKKDQKPGTMVMFKVDPAKKKSDKSPDFQGNGCIKPEEVEELMKNGGMVRISAWTKLPKGGGAPYISGFIEVQKPYDGDKSAPEAADDFITTPVIAQAQANDIQYAEVVSEGGDLPF